jgi:hypothetical protein
MVGVSDDKLMNKFISYFSCGYLTKRVKKDSTEFVVTKFSDIVEKIIPFYDKNFLEGSKHLDYRDFCNVATLVKEKRGLNSSQCPESAEGGKVTFTAADLERIRLIKSGMNTGRNYTRQE